MRYFIEVAYHGGRYAGFQIQQNALTIQEELQKALFTLLRMEVMLTGSSRTDTGVHARQNFFHLDLDRELHQKHTYSLNALLPKDMAVQQITRMPDNAHCRFDATGRRYKYYLATQKNPFTHDRSWHYPFPLKEAYLQEVASLLLYHTDYTSFSKRNTQTKTMICHLSHSRWEATPEGWVYEVIANRFLRGMVRGLVATMLQAGRGKISVQQFKDILHAKDCTRADFSAPGHGLFLEEVLFPEGYFTR